MLNREDALGIIQRIHLAAEVEHNGGRGYHAYVDGKIADAILAAVAEARVERDREWRAWLYKIEIPAAQGFGYGLPFPDTPDRQPEPAQAMPNYRG